MPVPAEMEEITIANRPLRLRWKSPRFGEWLAWCYVPSESGMPNEGVGFEARAASAEAARAEVVRRITDYLSAESGA